VSDATAPIGIFDSGLGGLSVLREVHALLPAEEVLYVADSAYCPYGTRPPAEIRARSLVVTGELVRRGVKLMILACNTACAVALPEVRERFAVPIVGLEPAVKPAIGLSRSGRIAVLATPQTIASDRLAGLIRDHANGVAVEAIAAPGLVDLVEAGQIEGDRVVRALRPLLEPLVARNVDVLVLGCTHYPFLDAEIRRLVGPGVRIVDSGGAIARRTLHVLEETGLRRPEAESPGALTVLTTGDVEGVAATTVRLLGREVAVSKLEI
jgi:glutamate racemase